MREGYGCAILSLALVIGGAPAAVRAQTCELVDLGTLGRSWSRAQNVSPAGAVVGGSPRDADAFPSPFVWRDGSMRALPARSGAATGVDSSGRSIVGETPDRAALWVDGVFSQLPSPTAGWATAAAINDQGVIIGATGPNLAGALATIWIDGRATVLGALEGDVFSRAWGVMPAAKSSEYPGALTDGLGPSSTAAARCTRSRCRPVSPTLRRPRSATLAWSPVLRRVTRLKTNGP